jgi:hypothetical protein
MENGDYAIVEILKGFLGEPKNEVDALSKKQWQFNCPTPKCQKDQARTHEKHNLEYNSKKHLFQCWKCEYSGFVYRLASDYGTQADLDRIQLILPPDKLKKFDNDHRKPKIDHHLITCKLPEGYRPLGKKRTTNLYKKAWEYLVHDRKVSPSLIDKYDIGYTETGPKKFRIIIPSRNALGRFNYYEARSYMDNAKITYMKPSSDEVAKNDIIFNEYFINWDLPIFLVEGVFDMFRVPNAIPILGKLISPLLTDQLVKHNPKVILCFDPDAYQKMEETYSLLSSLGLDVFFVDLVEYNKTYVEQNCPELKGEERDKVLNRDISTIYEQHGKSEVAKAISNIKKLDLKTIVEGRLKKSERQK